MNDNELKHFGEMTTMNEIINHLSKEGYTFDFNLSINSKAKENPLSDCPEQFVIDRHYRFEGESDPDDEAILYAISSIDGIIKGLLVDGYGTSSAIHASGILEKIKTRTV